MSWRGAINAGLERTTGYRVVKAAAPPPPPKPKPKPKPRPRPRARPSRPDRIKRYHDVEARSTMKAVRPWTMTSYFRIFALIVAVRYVLDRGVEGDMVECGVWRGGSMQAVARTLLGRGVDDRELHLFDTFEGMPEPTEEDRRVGGRTARELLESSPQTPRSVWAIADLPDVQAGMARTGYPAERVHYHAGLVQDTIPAQAPEQIALLRLDTDWYESTRHELAHLYDRVPSGGVIIVDDYDYWEGSRKAVDEFLAARGAHLLLVPVDSARVAVKP